MSTLKIRQPQHRKVVRSRVARVDRTSEHFVTITFASDEMHAFEQLGFDQCIRVFFPRPGQTALRLPDATGNGWIAKYYLTPGSSRPHVRNYTVRRGRPEAGEIDIEFVVHGDDSPASAWATKARPGDEAGLFADGIQYLPHDEAAWNLLVGDESAVPALLSIIEHAHETLRAEVFLEVPSAADIREIDTPEGVTLHWLPRDGGLFAGETPGRLALDAVRAAELPSGRAYAFVAGESGLATGLRRHLVADRGFAKEDVTFVGYWKHGKASLG